MSETPATVASAETPTAEPSAAAPAEPPVAASEEATGTRAAGDAAMRHAAELQQVKARAVKKIRALEDKLKASGAETEAEKQRCQVLLEERQALTAKVAKLEDETRDSASLQGKIALHQQQVLSLEGALQASQRSVEELQAANARQVDALTRDVQQLQEELEIATAAAEQESMAVELSC